MAGAQQPPQKRAVRLRIRSIVAGTVAALVLVLLIALGSRAFHWFDATLIGYAVGTIFATAAVTYKYTFWLHRPRQACIVSGSSASASLLFPRTHPLAL